MYLKYLIYSGPIHGDPEPAPPYEEPSILAKTPHFAVPDVPKIRIASEKLTSTVSLTPQQSYISLSTQPLPQVSTQTTPNTPMNDDAAIFKVPTSAVRRMSARQRAMVQQRKKPIISLPSYSIDRNFKRARRKPKMSLIDLQQLQQQRFPGRPRRQVITRHETVVEKVDVDIMTITKYFDTPQLIEPIMDLNIDMILFGASESDEDDEDEDQNDENKKHCVMHETNTREMDSVKANFDDTSFSDRCSSIENPTDTASTSMLSDLFAISSSSESESEDSAPGEPSSKRIKFSKLAEDFESPASPPPCEPVCLKHEPQAIPLETIYQPQEPCINIILKAAKRRVPRKSVSTPIEKTNPRAYYKVFKIITHYLDSALCTEDSLVQCNTHILQATQSPKLLATCILELTEDIDQDLDTTLTPPAPALTEDHKRIVLLVDRLHASIPAFSTYCQLLIEKSLFTMSKSDLRLSALVNLARLFVALHDLRKKADTSRIRIFIYKCLYYFQHKSTPIVYAVLMAHGDCLPRLPDPEVVYTFPVADFEKFDPLVQSIYTVLVDTEILQNEITWVKNGNMYKKHEMQLFLKSFFNYKGTSHKYSFLVQHLLQRICDNELTNLAYALVLVAKRKGWKWALANILEPSLLPKQLRTFVDLASSTNVHDDQIACILFVIAAIVKTMPLTEPVNVYHDLFSWVLDKTSNDRQVIQEAAVSALLLTARFGTIDVFNRIRHWIPDFRISRKLNTQLQTFIGRKPIAFWNVV